MDRQQWILLRKLIECAVRAVGSSRRVKFTDNLIVKMYFWAVGHDRPLCWACDRENYGNLFRPRKLPSVSQFCRRVKTDLFQEYLQHVHDATTGHRELKDLNFFDGKPLTVGNYSRDPEAKKGYAAGQMGKGYKLHALVNKERKIVAWSVESLNTHEMPVARTLIHQAVRVPKDALFLADGNYDAHKLHKDIHARGGWLWVKPRGMAKHPVTLRQMGPARRALLKVWEQTPGFAKCFYNKRIAVEGTFSNLTSFGGGLGPLPNFVRRLERVRRWVGAKIILYHVRMDQRKAAAT